MLKPSQTLAPCHPYSLKRSARKTVAIYIRHHAVEVRAPHHVSRREIDSWVSEKHSWIEKQLKQQLQKSHERPQVAHGEKLLFFGKHRDIIIKTGKNRVEDEADSIVIYAKHPDNIEKNQQLLEKWLKNEACHYVSERCMELAQTMDIVDHISRIQFRKTKSKWGHCSSAGVLQFNWLIIMAPVEVIDYLIIHELSHLSHMNHSKAFWARVSDFCPLYKQHNLWLKNQGHKITL